VREGGERGGGREGTDLIDGGGGDHPERVLDRIATDLERFTFAIATREQEQEIVLLLQFTCWNMCLSMGE
jgi:hypothetical protein